MRKLSGFIDHEILKVFFSVAVGAVTSYVGLYTSIQNNTSELRSQKEWQKETNGSIKEISNDITEIKIMLARELK